MDSWWSESKLGSFGYGALMQLCYKVQWGMLDGGGEGARMESTSKNPQQKPTNER